MNYTKEEIAQKAIKGEMCGCIININCSFHNASNDIYEALKEVERFGLSLFFEPLREQIKQALAKAEEGKLAHYNYVS